MGKSNFQRAAGKPLLSRDESGSLSADGGGKDKVILLYDTDVMLEMKSSLCEGYLTLLQGGCKQSKHTKNKVADQQALPLAYASLTDGNVIDACFGMKLSSKENGYATKMIKRAKAAIDKAEYTNEAVQSIAVEAYKNGFKSIIDMNKKLEKLNMFTACFFEKKIRRSAIANLGTSFEPLERAIAAN
jgi:hypothetical protein